jgi:hypothetical protein
MNCNGLNEIEGIQVIPVDINKKPIPTGWQTAKKKYDLSDVVGVGLVCGKPSGNAQAIDFDLKYSLSPTLLDDYKKLVHKADPTLLNQLVVQKTRNNGYHFIFRCSKIQGNQKLANRHTTESEKEKTYKDTYNAAILKGDDDAEAKKKAEKASMNDKVRVLIETREAGGPIVISPSEGYEFVFGDIQSITEITHEQRDILHDVARSFNEVVVEYIAPKNTPSYTKIKGLSTFQDYNERGNVEELLINNGWKIVGRKGSKTLFLRPGQSTAQSSGNYDHARKWFSVFSTSTDFEAQHAYQPYAVFAVLECNKDFSLASKKLYEMGYGDRFEEKPKAPSTRVIKSRINADDDDYSFLAKPEDYDGYLQQVIDGTLPQGLTTGSPELDKYFLFKEADLFMCNGHDNTGKSVFIWWLLLLAAMYHGWKGIIYSSENTLGGFMRKMIQFYWGKPLRGNFAMNEVEYKIAKDFVEKHFKLIKAQEDLFNYKDVINMVKKTRKLEAFNYAMIDPYNSLKIDLSGFSKLSTHEYHYEAISEIKAYGQQTKFGWFINHHAVTAAVRAKDGEKKYPIAPQKADTEGGGKFGNKADTFATIHRITQHPTDWMVTEFHVRKMKDTDTGGRVTPFDSPVKFEMYKGGCGFIEKLDGFGFGVDPIAKWHKSRNPSQAKIEVTEDKKTWLPYSDGAINEFEEDPF